MKLISTFFLLVLTAVQAQGQTNPPRTVNGLIGTADGQLNGNFSSVTAALAWNPPSSGSLIINVVGMTNSGGPLPYSEAAHPGNPNSSAVGESFPIVVPSNVLIRAAPSGGPPVVFASTGPGAILFQTPSSPPVGYRCRLESLGMYAAGVGFRVNKAVTNKVEIQLDGITFANCEIGLSASSSAGGSAQPLDVLVSDCWIRDYPLASNPPVSPPATSDIGLLFSASGSGADVGYIDAEVVNLKTVGDFAGTESMGTSSVIRVLSSGTTVEHPGGVGSLAPISEVFLDVQGGQLEGHSKDGGWNYGIRADVTSSRDPGDIANDYVAGYRVFTSGLTMTGFIENGIRAHASVDTRGEVNLNGGTKINNIRDTSGSGQTAPSGTGVYLQNSEGYLALHTNMIKVSGNATHGVQLSNSMTDSSGKNSPDYGLPEGLYLDMESTELSGNEGDGLKMIASGAIDGGVVGGTRFLNPVDSQYYHVPSTSWPEFPNGQGSIVRSAIHNNYGAGLNGHLVLGAGSVRMVRAVVWNNNLEGWRWQVDDNACRMACPILFSTIAGNGGGASSPANATVSRGSSVTQNRYNLNVLPTSAGLLHTKILHSIFTNKVQSQGGVWLDFGGELRLLMEEDSGSSSSQEIYATGIRTREELFTPAIQFPPEHRRQAFIISATGYVKFRGLTNQEDIQWTSSDPGQFRLFDSNGDGFGNALDEQYTTQITDWLGNLMVPSADYEVDFNGNPTASGFSGTDWTGTALTGFTMNKGAFEQ